MPTLTLKNIPKRLHARLKESADRNRRSLNSEILTRLGAQFSAPVVDVEARIRPKGPSGKAGEATALLQGQLRIRD